MSELRQNVLTGDWVVIAAHRAMRPESFSREIRPPLAERLAGCPFCAGNESQTPPEIFALRQRGAVDQPGWLVRVVPNKFPALAPTAQNEARLHRHGDSLKPVPIDLYPSLPGKGRHEVIIHGPDHNRALAAMAEDEVAAVFGVYQHRLLDLKRDPGLAAGIIVVNHGREAGASIEHPHSQLFAMTFVPPLIAREVAGIRAHKNREGVCPLCAMVEREREGGQRLVAENDHFLAFCPYASRAPFEIYIVPKDHQRDFSAMSEFGITAAAAMAKECLSRLYERLGDPPYNVYLHTAPFSGDDDFHWHLVVLPKTSVVAGFEFGTGIMINVTEPEAAAEFLR